MKNTFIISSFFLMSLYLNSCSNYSYTTRNNYMYDVDSLRAKFVITAQDSTVSSDKEVIYYSILSDSIGRRFLVAEVGCSDQQNKLLIQKGIKDTVSIKINRYTNRGQAQIRTTNEILFIIGKDGDSYEVYETAQLCKHKLIE